MGEHHGKLCPGRPSDAFKGILSNRTDWSGGIGGKIDDSIKAKEVEIEDLLKSPLMEVKVSDIHVAGIPRAKPVHITSAGQAEEYFKTPEERAKEKADKEALQKELKAMDEAFSSGWVSGKEDVAELLLARMRASADPGEILILAKVLGDVRTMVRYEGDDDD